MDFVRRVLLVLCIGVCGSVAANSYALTEHDASAASDPYAYRQEPGVDQPASAASTTRPSATLQPSSKARLWASLASGNAQQLVGYASPGSSGGQCNYPPIFGKTLLEFAQQSIAANNALSGPGPCSATCPNPVQLTSIDQANNTYTMQSLCTGWFYTASAPPVYSLKTSFHDCPNLGNPCNIPSGAKIQAENDYESGDGGLEIHRDYNSRLPQAFSGSSGLGWRFEYENSATNYAGMINASDVKANGLVAFVRPSGQVIQFTYNSGSGHWESEPDITAQVLERDDTTGNFLGWSLYPEMSALREDYDNQGRLVAIDYSNGNTVTLQYDAVTGGLTSATDSRGRLIQFVFSSAAGVSQLSKVTLPDGAVITYAYNNAGQLASVNYPAGADGIAHSRVYGYTNNLLTSLTDENGNLTSSWTYASDGSVISSIRGAPTAPLSVYSFQYNSDGSVTTTSPLGQITNLTSQIALGVNHITGADVYCADCGSNAHLSDYDANGRLSDETDFLGATTTFSYNTAGMEVGRVEATGTASQRTLQTTWDAFYKLPVQRTVFDASNNMVAKTSWVYNTFGQPLARCEIDPAIAAAASYICAATGTVPAGVRRWAYTYCTAVNGAECPIVGLLLTVKGPRTDLIQTTTYSYYLTSSATGCGTPGAACHRAGDLYRFKDVLGHLTTYTSYDATGRVTRITDANGVNTDLTYTSRGWLTKRIVGGAITTFGYDAMGELTSIKDPSGIATTFTYDAAHRLTDITDAQGNVIHYTLDAAGNKTGEQTRNAAGTVVRSLSRRYNTLGQLTAIVDGLNHTVFNAGYSDSYDADGNLVHSADALGFQRQQGFDALNRLNSTIANYNGTDPATQNTQTAFDYDALDRLDGVTDPSELNTLYTYDGLNNRTELQSPDTGTSADTYDAAGNRLTHTDANGVISTSTYDALNRLTGTSYVDTTQNVSYAYDEADTVTGCTSSKPKGRLTRIVEGGITTAYCYNSRGKILQKRQITASQTDTTTYTYTVADRLSKLTTPDNTVVTYAYNTDGLPSSVKVTPSGATSASPTVVSAITWLPFGPISSYKLGNGQTVKRTYDANYRVTDLTSPALNLHFKLDAMGNIIALGNAPGANPAAETYSYDPLNRLNGISDAATALESYTYNPSGDRLSKTAPGLATGTYLYTTGTHQLAGIGNAPRANDANGNTTGSLIGGETFGFAYNARNRLTLAQRNGQTVGTYSYNALGQRIANVAAFPQAVTTRYAYNDAGQLIGEYGTSNRDYVWLGDLPVAVIDNAINGSVTTSVVNYVTADQLGTPRAVTNSAGTVIWQWAYTGNPFGEKQPTSSTGYMLNLRYAGQYYDAETGTNYNMFRTYEPATGRYLQPDPLGQAAGPSLFGYVGGNPLSSVDPLGLCDQDRCAQLSDKINQLRNELAKRYGDLQANELGLPLTGPMSIGGHQQQFENKQTQLRKLLNDFDSQGCNGGLPPDAWEYATKDAPSPSNWNPVHAPDSSVRNALIGAGLFIGGVVVFIGNAASEVL